MFVKLINYEKVLKEQMSCYYILITFRFYL